MKFINLAIFSFATFAMAAPSGAPGDANVPENEEGVGKVILKMATGEYWKQLPDQLNGAALKKVFEEFGGDLTEFIGNVTTIHAKGSHGLQASNGEPDVKAAAIEETLQKIKSLSDMESLSDKEKRDFFNGSVESKIVEVIISGVLWLFSISFFRCICGLSSPQNRGIASSLPLSFSIAFYRSFALVTQRTST